MFIVQPTSSFGDRICEELDLEADGHRQWQSLEFAAAWVNSSGAEKIKESARRFLAEGGCIRAVVGLDFASTSYEGLGILLDLESETADIETYVFFDENRACTFHPKVYLFSNSEEARLFVGSNNMTGGGLETNVEATLGFTSGLDDGAIRAARQTLEAWREDNLLRSRRLTREVLEQLHDQGYVRTEKEIRLGRKSEAESRPSKGKPLFGRSKTQGGGAGPKKNGPGPSGGSGPKSGGPGPGGGFKKGPDLQEALLMRVRKRRDGGQIQIPLPIHSSFMKGATEAVSIDETHHPIGFNKARGKEKNTAQMSDRKVKGCEIPVARFWWDNNALRYEIFDATAGEGAEIFETLEEGIGKARERDLHKLSHEGTVISISDPDHAQWFRLDWI